MPISNVWVSVEAAASWLSGENIRLVMKLEEGGFPKLRQKI